MFFDLESSPKLVIVIGDDLDIAGTALLGEDPLTITSLSLTGLTAEFPQLLAGDYLLSLIPQGKKPAAATTHLLTLNLNAR